MSALIVIGNFDGVHRGHQALLRDAFTLAEARQLDLRLLTFVPHPYVVLGREPPPLLTAQPRKRELLRRVVPGLAIIEQAFDLEFAAQTARAFAERLVKQLEARVVVVGQNFRFGKGREGGGDDLRDLGAEVGFEARSAELRGDDGGTWSSTRARALIARGEMVEAEAILGRPHMISGRVVTGKQLGRTIGFPTCNLGGVLEMSPPYGVYAVMVDHVRDGVASPLALGAMSIGENPTTDRDGGVKIEVHLLDHSSDLYGEELRVHVVHRLRGEEKFDTLDALVAQITLDVEQSRAVLADRRRDLAG